LNRLKKSARAWREVDLGSAESVEDVAGEVALGGAGGDCECGLVDPLAGGDVGVGDPDRHARNDLRALDAAGSR
jgi:hypothetical protein